ncbi:plasmid replication protein RepC [uncultured Tateyamaria sp.]|uniref:plasmid replication protein RepC n=1 Tax=uncultured Tateyamaria sp. TaxID=455651 RepID=UPI002636113B|nr:plasmid replication protein RepC [uncultured Tateyamaria sp.]
MMTIHAQTTFGQAGTRASAGPATVDKWKLLEALTHAAPSFGIGHRQIGVLRALISFHQQRFWAVTADRLIVYPSNRTLCDRLGGMPDSTLRRHLAALVRAGLITRRTSSNGKRFRRGRGAQEVAFGLDLAPLVVRSAAITRAAQEHRAQAEAQAAERARLLALREELRVTDPVRHGTFLADLGRAIRRKLSIAELKQWIAVVQEKLSAVIRTKKMNASDSQNERHIEPQKRINTVEPNGADTLTPHELQRLCKERATYFPQPMRDWSDVMQSATDVAKMIGLAPHDLQNSTKRHGRLAVSVVVLYTLEVIDRIDAPAAYFRRLAETPNILETVTRALRQTNLSADNSYNSLLSGP